MKEIYGEAFAKCYVVFLSNEQRAIPLWKQKNAKGEDKPVIWVSKYQILLKKNASQWMRSARFWFGGGGWQGDMCGGVCVMEVWQGNVLWGWCVTGMHG